LADPDRDPEEPVAGAQARALAGRARQDCGLLAQQEVLGDEVAAASEHRTEHGDEQTQLLEHARQDAASAAVTARSDFSTPTAITRRERPSASHLPARPPPIPRFTRSVTRLLQRLAILGA
jgi:hypothetical protein